jgi:hypothetical protein
VHGDPGPATEEAAEEADAPQDEGGHHGHQHGEQRQLGPVHPPEHEGLGAAPEDVEGGLDEGEAGQGQQLEQATQLGPGPRRLTRAHCHLLSPP